jgi:hypothetical protein
MFDVGASLRDAFDRARDRLQAAQTSIALANSGRLPGRSADSALSETAATAIFSEALLAAQRARFAEIKAVTK